MEEREEQMTLTEGLEAMLAVLRVHTEHTGQGVAPGTLDYLLGYCFRTELLKQAVRNRAEQLGLMDPEAGDNMDPALSRVCVKALIALTGRFTREPDRQALYLLYGLEDGVPRSAAQVARILDIGDHTVRQLDHRFRKALRPRSIRRNRIRDFYA